jgi:hypothetical protein
MSGTDTVDRRTTWRRVGTVVSLGCGIAAGTVCALALVMVGRTSDWSKNSSVIVERVLGETHQRAALTRARTGRWPMSKEQLPPLSDGLDTKRNLVQLDGRYFDVFYSPGPDRWHAWDSLITLEGRRVNGSRFFLWREVYAVDKQGRVAIGKGCNAPLVALLVLAVPLLALPALVRTAFRLRQPRPYTDQ